MAGAGQLKTNGRCWKERNTTVISSSKTKGNHAERMSGISQELQDVWMELAGTDKMKFEFDDSALPKGKILFTATNLNFGYNSQLLWKEDLSFQITSGERIDLKGNNGSGKTMLNKITIREAGIPNRNFVQHGKPSRLHILGLFPD